MDTLLSIDGDCQKNIFSPVMHFKVELNFSAIRYMYNNLLIIYIAAQNNSNILTTVDGNF